MLVIYWRNSWASHLLTAVVQCNHLLAILPYLKLPFELRSSRLLLRTYSQPTHQLCITHQALGCCTEYSLGTDSSSLKVAGLHTMVQNTASAPLFVRITWRSTRVFGNLAGCLHYNTAHTFTMSQGTWTCFIIEPLDFFFLGGGADIFELSCSKCFVLVIMKESSHNMK